MLVVSILSFKGGVGKSTTAVHLAASAYQRGFRVLVIDLDFQGSAAQKLMGPLFQPASGAGHWLNDTPFEEIVIRARPNDHFTPSVETACIDLVPGEASLEFTEVQLTMKGESTKLVNFLADLDESDRYDLVVIDTHPSNNRLSTNAIHAADVIITPFAAEPDAYHGPANVLRRIQEVEKSSRRQIPTYLLPTMYDTTNGSPSPLFVQAVAEKYGHYPDGKVLPWIMASKIIKSTVTFGQTMYEFRPGHATTKQYDRILDIIQEISQATYAA